MAEVASEKPSAVMASAPEEASSARANGKSERDATSSSSSLENDPKRRKQSHASTSSTSASSQRHHHGASSSSSSSRGTTSSSNNSNSSSQSKSAPPSNSAEERERYELERKKVAKYKEDKLKARRDHTRMILESHAQAKRRALMGKQSEFLTTLEFRNQLPDLPFDTKFLHYPYEKDRLVKYKPNTLEQDYTYEIHEEPNLGLAIDLIDPERYEAPKQSMPLEIGDEAALMMKEASLKNQKAKARPAVTWLRRSELMGTDLYNAVHKFRNEIEVQSEIREKNESALAEVIKFSLEDRAEASFEEIKHPNTLVHPFNRNLKIKKCWDVVPDPRLSCNEYAILSYDLLPSSDINKPSMVDKENRAILCGVSKKTQGPEALLGSIMFPTSGGNDEERDPSSEKFAYFRDYQLSVHKFENRKQQTINEECKEEVKDDSQHCLFLFDRESDIFTYTDISHRVQLRKTKMSGEENRRRGAIVHRRPYSEGEQDRRESILMEIGAMYHDSLDDKSARAAAKKQMQARRPAQQEDSFEEEEEERKEDTNTGDESDAEEEKPSSDKEDEQSTSHVVEKEEAPAESKDGLDFGSDSSDDNDDNGNDSPAISSGSDSE